MVHSYFTISTFRMLQPEAALKISYLHFEQERNEQQVGMFSKKSKHLGIVATLSLKGAN